MRSWLWIGTDVDTVSIYPSRLGFRTYCTPYSPRSGVAIPCNSPHYCASLRLAAEQIKWFHILGKEVAVREVSSEHYIQEERPNVVTEKAKKLLYKKTITEVKLSTSSHTGRNIRRDHIFPVSQALCIKKGNL